MSTTALKLLAMLLMLLDHIHYFIPDMPIWLTWLGRLSAPLFGFCSAWGFYYTRSRKRYLLNLYGWNVGMAFATCAVTALVPYGYNAPVNNIFGTLFLAWAIVAIAEEFIAGRTARAFRLTGIFVAAQCVSLLLYSTVYALTGSPYQCLAASALLPSVLLCEGGLVFVALYVCLYFTRQKPKMLAAVYIGFSALFFFSALHAPYAQSLLYYNYQWMMVGALPLMLCYNGQKGRGLKWLFYVFYPAHVYLLYWLGSQMIL